MMHLILVACLTVPSYACRQSSLIITEQMSEIQCAITAQQRIAVWNEEHPQWRVVRWRCQYEIAQKL
jgi:acyl-ACP thioesterase